MKSSFLAATNSLFNSATDFFFKYQFNDIYRQLYLSFLKLYLTENNIKREVTKYLFTEIKLQSLLLNKIKKSFLFGLLILHLNYKMIILSKHLFLVRLGYYFELLDNNTVSGNPIQDIQFKLYFTKEGNVKLLPNSKKYILVSNGNGGYILHELGFWQQCLNEKGVNW